MRLEDVTSLCLFHMQKIVTCIKAEPALITVHYRLPSNIPSDPLGDTTGDGRDVMV